MHSLRLGLTLLLLSLLGTLTAFAEIKPANIPSTSSIVKMVENKGQWLEKVRFEAGIPGGKIFFEQNRLTYLLADLHHLHDAYFHTEGDRDERPIDFSGHVFQLNFIGANPNAEIIPTDQYPEYNNYFLGKDPQKWASHVPVFGALTYKSIYPGIDLLFYGKDKALKYDFVLAPQADPNLINLNYEGLEGIRIASNGDLVFPTNIGEFRELRPYAFQIVDGIEVEVPVNFVLNGQNVSFDFPEGFRSEIELVIDPIWIFGSYSGSTADNFGFTATYDTSGNLYGGGISFALGYPTSVGAFQTNYVGGSATPFGTGFDMTISKFNPTGTALVWSTYIGGSDNEQPQSLITTDNAELVIYGRTLSNNYPTTPGAFQTARAGGSDIVVTKLNAAGTALLGSTYIGGTANDGLNMNTNFFQNSLYFNYGDDSRGEVMLDASNNIYVASCTQSNNFPVTAGCFQNTFGGGLQDACVLKLNANLTGLIWATYLGGSANDAAYSIKVDATGVPYVAGGTESANFPTTSGVVQPAYGGAIDGFISRLSTTGNALTASTFIGTSAYDQCYFLELDAMQNVYVVGQSLGPFPVTSNVYSDPGSSQFVARYDSDLTTKAYSTVFGSGRNTTDISPTAFLVDRCGFLYVSGWGGGTNNLVGNPGTTQGMPVTANAFQSNTVDNSDFYIIVLTPDARALEYATYYGSPTSAEHVDGGTSRFDRNLIVYQAACAGCQNDDDFPTTVGAVSQSNNSTNCNMGVFKFAFDAQDIRASFASQTFDSCAPFPVTFTNTSLGGLSFEWNFGDGSPTVTTFNASHTYLVPGSYEVTLAIVDSNSCNVVDTVRHFVNVFANPIAIAGGSDTICSGNDIQLTSGGGAIYDWSPGLTLDDSTIANPVASPNVNTNYTVIVIDSNGCRDTASVDVFVTHYFADAGSPASFCEGTGGAQLQAGAITGGTGPFYYTWYCDSTATFCGLDSTYDDDPIANPSVTTMYYLQISDSRGCLSELDSVLVEILPVPIADAGPDQYICQQPAPGALLQGSFSNAPGPFTYYWINQTGLNDSTLLQPFARPDTTTIYTLVGISANGCSSNPTTTDTLSTVTVHVQPRPIADAGPDIHTCLYDTTVIQGIGFGAGPNYDFQWTPYTGLSDSAVANPIASPPITTTYTLVVYSNGCPSYGDSMTVWVHTLPTPSAGNIREICLGDSAYLDAFAAGDSSASYTYNWFPSAGLNNPTLENPTASPDTTTWYYLIATSSWGCDSPLDSVLVRLKPSPIAEAGENQEICLGDSVTLPGTYYYTTTDSANPTEIYYAWSPNTSINDSTYAQPIVWPSQSMWYHFSVRTNTCETSDSVLVQVNPGLGSWAEADTNTSCAGDSVQFFAGGGLGGASISWSPTTGLDDPFSFSPMAAPGDTTTYVATIIEGGCTETQIVHLNILAMPEAAYTSSEAEGCPPHAVQFQDLSLDAIAHIWNFGDGSPVSNFPEPQHIFERPGDFIVTHTAISIGNCTSSKSSIIVHVRDTVLADFSSNPSFPVTLSFPNTNIQFFDETKGAAKLNWDFGDGIRSTEINPVHVYHEEGTFFVTLNAWSDEGCKSSVVHGPYIIAAADLFIPNVFSPNDDGLNDSFLPLYSGSQPYALQIFDRWGVPYFQTVEKTMPWNGKTEAGDLMPEGVYYYVLKIGNKEYSGNVTLVR